MILLILKMRWIQMYYGRDLVELQSIPLSNWSMEELSYHHHMMSNMVSYMNQQGVSFHQDLIEEIVKRGGIHAGDVPSYTSHVEDSGDLMM